MKKRILITYGSYGSGHKTIANYIKNYIEDNYDYEIKILDFTEHSNIIGKIGVKLFDFNIKYRTKFLFNLSYELMDHKFTTFRFKKFTKKSFDNNYNRKFIIDFDPDITISTHFFGNNLVSYYNDLNLTHSKILTIITDYKSHQWWIANHKNEDAFIVANEVVKNELVDLGVPSNKIFPYGLPVNPNIDNLLKSKEDILKEYKLSGDKPVLLFFGGGSAGSMSYFDYFKIVAKQNYNVDLIFICGKNEKLKNKCDDFIKSKNIKNVKVLGFTTDVFNLMKISDAVISKAGGATVTECLEMNTPMIVIPGYGGQEKYNERFMLRKRFALRARTYFGLKRIVKKVSKNPVILKRIRLRMLNNDKNNSVSKICKLVDKMLKK